MLHTLPVTAALTAFAAIFLVLLSFPIANHRRANKISAGDAGDDAFNRKIRAQANFIEYTPLAIIAIGLLEANSFPQIYVCVLAAGLVLARVLHAIGLIWNTLIARASGAVLTFLVLLGAGGILAVHSVIGHFH